MQLLNQEQNKLVIEAIKDKRDYFANRIGVENDRKYPNSLTVRKLKKKCESYDEILNVIQKSDNS